MTKHNALKFMANSYNEKQFYGDNSITKKAPNDATKGS